ncbi:MAG: hypothetical protein D4R50_02185 [Actinomycetales bacterium]|nr:MAG: hypothetical protein D4R50_02185 [Actinomycetales bacterium]
MIIRSESRIVRPFIGLDKAASTFSGTKLLIDGQEFDPGTVVIPDSQIRSATVSLQTGTTLQALRQACDKAGVPHKSAKYILVARSRMLRRSSSVYEHTISSSNFDETINIDRLTEDRFVFKDRSGFVLIAALILNEAIASKPLQVHLPGTWLGSAKFTVRPQNDQSSFSPLPLDKAAREKFGLRTGTYSYIDMQEELLSLDDLSDGVIAYLDEDVLNLLLTDESESVPIAIQTQFATQTLFAIAKQISQEMASSTLELQDLKSDSGALRFILRMASECKIDANDLLEMGKSNESLLLSLIESKLDLANKIEKLLKGN